MHKVFAERLVAENVGVWKPAGAYTLSETGIYFENIPDNANNAIALSFYDLESELDEEAVLTGVQVTIRATPDRSQKAYEIAGAVKSALDGWESPADNVALCWLQSGSSLGMDPQKRQGYTQNFYAYLMEG